VETSYQKSDKIGKLVQALAKARLSFSTVKKEQENPYYKSKYADLNSLIEATKNALAVNELAVIQLPSNNGQGVEIETLLVHSSDEWISCRLRMPIAKADAQGVGSAITYGRRYAYGAILNIASEDDDDGNAATGKGPERGAKATDTGGLVNGVQAEAWHSACKVGGRTDQQKADFLAEMGFEVSKDKPLVEGIQEALRLVPQNSFPYIIRWALNKPADPNLEAQLESSVQAVQKRKYVRKERTLEPVPDAQAGD
jgi:hypothetical protein